MEVIIIYFSQTGNTYRIAVTMSEAFQQAGHPTRMVNLKQASIEDAIEGDLIGVGTSCISSKAPTPIKLFLQSLPPIPGRNAFIFATSGGAPGRVLSEISRILFSKGANVLGGFSTHGQVNHPAPHLFGRFPDRPNSIDLDRAHRFVLEVSAQITEGHSNPLLQRGKPILNSNRGFNSILGLISTDRVVRLLLPQPKLNLSSCNQCRFCADECPMGNIIMDPNPIIGELSFSPAIDSILMATLGASNPPKLSPTRITFLFCFIATSRIKFDTIVVSSEKVDRSSLGSTLMRHNSNALLKSSYCCTAEIPTPSKPGRYINMGFEVSCVP